MQIESLPSRNNIAIFSILTLVSIFLIGFHSRPVTGNSERKTPRFPSGLTTDPYELYESLPVFHASTDKSLPHDSNFEAAFSPPGDQGNQKSSAGFAVSFGLISFLEAEKNKRKILSNLEPLTAEGLSIFYSPAYLYNQLNNGRDSGSSLLETLILAQSRGAVTLKEMPYSPSNFRTKPGGNQIEIGRNVRLSQIFKVEPTDLTSIKYAVSKKIPVMISFLTFDNFLEAKGDSLYSKVSGEPIGAQSLIVIGFDDDKHAFRVWNSWGKNWADNGYLWIEYSLFQKLTKAAYIATSGKNETYLSEKQALETLNQILKNGDLISTPTEVHVSKGEFKDKIRLVWQKIDRAIGYEIYRKRKGETKYQLVGLSKIPAFEDFGVQKDQAYIYRVASLDESQISEPSPESNEGYASSDVKITELLPITNLNASVGGYNDRIVLSWDSHLTADSYSVYKWNASSKIFRFLGKTGKPNFTDYKATKNGDSEIYRVFPHNKSNTGEGSVYTQGYLDPLRNLKLRPENLAVSKGEFNDKIILSWDNTPNAEAYIVFRTPVGENDWEKIGQTSELKFVDTKLNESDYSYSVSAVFSDQSISLPSEIASGFKQLVAKRGNESEITEIENVEANSSRREINISWRQNLKAESFSLFMRKKQGKDWKLVATVDRKLKQFLVTNLDKNQFYFFALKTKESGKEISSFSKSVVGVISETIVDSKKVRTFSESTITKFLGPWTAMHWDGKSSIKPIKLEVQSDDNDGYILKWNNEEFYRGNYVIDANLLEEKGKWKIQLSPNLDSLSADVYEKSLLPEKSRLSFVRE
ncbi:cysteine protease [Leptospira ognonensis]|uniref:Cysteine protease n=1 Tax=Leptospira ognonensis TaxID=2484945 RepID=A0A4V3JS08_9LEPT|nr:C1 family peptidase [Leptospira ognonensis]TGL61771.1 cysteine protease [Leptospira ognonensis]